MTDRPLALVTGASAGIGLELARVAAADGYDVVLVARRGDRLAALAETLPGAPLTFEADLAVPGAAATVVREIERMGRPIDVLVNNAGFGHAGAFAEAPAERLTGMIDLNCRAVVALAHLVLPGMLARGRGGILNVASTAAVLPGPNNAIYYATKAFVLSFSEALHEEVRGTGVAVTALCPGPTTTEFGAVSGMARFKLFRLVKGADAAHVAAVGWRGFRQGRRVVIEGNRNRLGWVGTRLMPHRLLLPIVKRIQSE